MDLALQGKRAIVMAASEGLGLAAALSLAREGVDIAICARRQDVLEAAAKRIEDETGRSVVARTCDVTDGAALAAFIEEATGVLGGLDILVTNKGGPRHGQFADMGDADWQAAFELVVLSYVRAVRAALPHLIASGQGAVVAIESMSVKKPIGNLVLSNALRPAVVGLSKSLAFELADEGVRFNVVLPGSMDTERIRDLTRDVAERQGTSFDDAMAQRLADIPLGRLGRPGELGDLIAYLASPAAGYITGAVVQLDGGVIESVV